MSLPPNIEKLRQSGGVAEIRLPVIGKVWVSQRRSEMTGGVLKDSRDVYPVERDDGGIAGLRWWMPGIFRGLANNMLTMDEPDHTRLRGNRRRSFRRRAILELEPPSLRSPTNSSLANCLRMGAQLISSSNMRGYFRFQ